MVKPTSPRRVGFNREAKQLRADDDLPGLKTLAISLLGPPLGPGAAALARSGVNE